MADPYLLRTSDPKCPACGKGSASSGWLVGWWLWLARFAYIRATKANGVKPTGIPYNRDPEFVCTGYEPRPKKLRDWRDCEGDGHYLCMECCHKTEQAMSGEED